MPYQFGWHKPPHVTEACVFGIVTAADVEAIAQAAFATLDESDVGLVYSIVDITDIQRVEVTAAWVMGLPSVLRLVQHKNLGWTAVYGSSNPFMNYMLNLVYVAFGGRVLNCDDRAEAIRCLIDKGAPLDPTDPA